MMRGGGIWEMMGWDGYCGGDVDIFVVVVGTFFFGI